MSNSDGNENEEITNVDPIASTSSVSNKSTNTTTTERGKEIDNDERNRIIGRWQAGQSRHEISRQTGISTSAISRLIVKFEKTGTVTNLPRKGRPLNISEKSKNDLIELAKSKKQKFWTFDQLMKAYEQSSDQHPPIKKANARRILKLAEIKLLKDKPGVKKKQKQSKQKSKKNNVSTINQDIPESSNSLQEEEEI